MKTHCCECDKGFLAYKLRPLTTTNKGTTEYICRRCWFRYNYGQIMGKSWEDLS